MSTSTTVVHTGNPIGNFGGLITDPVNGIGIPFMLAGPILCAICIVVYIIVSLRTEPMPAEKLENVCWDHPMQAFRGKLEGFGDPRSITIILLVVMITLYTILR